MIFKSLAAAAAIAFAATSANAAVTFYSYGVGAPALTLVTDFSGDTLNAQPTTTPVGYSWENTGTASILDTTSGAGAEPAVTPGVYGTGNYLSVQTNQSETLDITRPNVEHVQIYLGSLDAYNTIIFGGPGGATYTGTDLGLISGAHNGNQTADNTNGLFDFTFSAPVTSITFQSSQNSLEIASIAAPVPEASSWAMMLLGLGGVGAAIRMSRRAKGAALTAA